MKKTDINKKREKEKQMVSYIVRKIIIINIIRAVSIKMACVLSVRGLLSMQD